MTDHLTNAFLLAREAHEGQTDKAGEPYILHPQAVANLVRHHGDEYAAVGYLHDVLEDTSMTEEMLRAMFPAEVVDAVVAMTHLPGEPRHDYLLRVKANPIALVVKDEGDIEHNSSEARLAVLDDKTAARLRKKYANDREVLRS